MVAMPVATWRPCVKRYKPAGRAMRVEPGGGFCWRCDHRPVAKQMVNETPNAMPSHAAVRSSWSRLVNRGSVVGVFIAVRRSWAKLYAVRGERSSGRRPPKRRLREAHRSGE